MIYWAIAVLVLLYGWLLIGSAVLWKRGGSRQFPTPSEFPSVTVIVPFRDESAHLEGLLEGLAQQNYPNLQIVLVNDHSTDDYLPLIHRFSQVACFDLPQGLTGKKAALSFGVAKANSEILLFTDADCTHQSGWVSTMVKQLLAAKLDWLAGPIKYRLESNFLSFFQVLENAYLLLISAASIQIQKPTTCNGANIAVKRSVFLESGGYDDLSKTPSGDDELLMQKLSKMGYHLGYCLDVQASVQTRFPHRLNQAINQKTRWASKLRYNVLPYNFMLAGFILMFHLCSLVLLVLAPFGAFVLLFWRLLIEWATMVVVFGFFGYKIKRGYFLVSFFVYPLYVIFMVIKSQFKSFTWKGRTY